MERSNIVCTCMDITYGDIEDAVKQGATSFEQVQEMTEAGTVCGACVDTVEELVGELLNQ